MPAFPVLLVFLVLGTAVPSARCLAVVKDLPKISQPKLDSFDVPSAISAFEGPIIPNIKLPVLPKFDQPKIELPKIDLPKIGARSVRSAISARVSGLGTPDIFFPKLPVMAKFDQPKIDLPKIPNFGAPSAISARVSGLGTPDIFFPKLPVMAKFDQPKIDLPKIDIPNIGARSCGQCSPNNLPAFHTQADIEADSRLETVGLIQKYGFPVETHFGYTADGYKLCQHRIPRPGATPILLVHGLMASSASWVQLGPQYGLAYILYLKGYDVWMLNTRGNIYSRDHLKAQLPDSQYWDFSFHEIGVYDLPAAVDLILQKTLQPQLQYIGHSQGSTVFFVMCSERSEYAAKVGLMQSLSPTVFLQGNRSPVLQFLGFFKGPFAVLMGLLGGHEISLKTTLIQRFRQHICSSSNLASRICALFDYVLCGFDWRGFNETLAPIIEGHSSQGCSAKQVHHYAQQQGQLLFQRYDHGRILNHIRYGSFSPPQYNLSLALSKVVLYRGGGDWLGSDFDAGQLQQRLPNCIESRKVAFDSFSHFDFTISKDVRPLVYDQVVAQCGSN